MLNLALMITLTFTLGLVELYQTYRYYKWDKKAKENPMSPAVIYYGGYFGAVLVVLSLVFMTGTTNIKLGHAFYVILGICIMIVAMFIFRRGRQMSKKLKKNDSNIQVVQVYIIATVLFFHWILKSI